MTSRPVKRHTTPDFISQSGQASYLANTATLFWLIRKSNRALWKGWGEKREWGWWDGLRIRWEQSSLGPSTAIRERSWDLWFDTVMNFISPRELAADMEHFDSDYSEYRLRSFVRLFMFQEWDACFGDSALELLFYDGLEGMTII
ncbi:hypothetical protein RRG08_064971 [Elysia crispata]|uniref:Uncharacterized protein n=1 Tax=Elysia crispata TaxID=231223 RepID=A0AAE1CVL7_9GAST|nr:hypothetical protein RRG08_064971 [Elysia crispata]